MAGKRKEKIADEDVQQILELLDREYKAGHPQAKIEPIARTRSRSGFASSTRTFEGVIASNGIAEFLDSWNTCRNQSNLRSPYCSCSHPRKRKCPSPISSSSIPFPQRSERAEPAFRRPRSLEPLTLHAPAPDRSQAHPGNPIVHLSGLARAFGRCASFRFAPKGPRQISPGQRTNCIYAASPLFIMILNALINSLALTQSHTRFSCRTQDGSGERPPPNDVRWPKSRSMSPRK